MFLKGLVAGLMAGVLCGLSRVHFAGPVDVIVNSIPVYLLVPLAVGAWTVSWRAGLVASVAQMAAFFVVTRAFEHVVFWFGAAVAAGAVFGFAGAAVSARLRARGSTADTTTCR